MHESAIDSLAELFESTQQVHIRLALYTTLRKIATGSRSFQMALIRVLEQRQSDPAHSHFDSNFAWTLGHANLELDLVREARKILFDLLSKARQSGWHKTAGGTARALVALETNFPSGDRRMAEVQTMANRRKQDLINEASDIWY